MRTHSLRRRRSRPSTRERLRAALWQYARDHDGHFPTAASPDVPAERWLVPGQSQQRYLYVAGQTADRDAVPLVIGGRYGLSSKEFTPGMVAGVFDELAREQPSDPVLEPLLPPVREGEVVRVGRDPQHPPPRRCR